MRAIFFVVALALGSLAAHAGDAYVQKSCKMTIDGTSTLHDWSCPVNTVRAKGNLTVEGQELAQVSSMWVQVDVLSIKSAKGEDMDEKIYEALKAEKNPQITFNLSTVKSLQKDGDTWKIETSGDLTVAGTKKPVSLTVSGTVTSSGDVRFKGSTKIKMATFDVERPSAMLGMIKAGEEVTITFDLTLTKG